MPTPGVNATNGTDDPFTAPYEDAMKDIILGSIFMFLYIPCCMSAFSALYAYYWLHWDRVKRHRKSRLSYGDVLMGNISIW